MGGARCVIEIYQPFNRICHDTYVTFQQVFAGGRSYDDPSLVKEYVLARIALDLIDEATVLAFDEVQLVDIAGAVSRVTLLYVPVIAY